MRGWVVAFVVYTLTLSSVPALTHDSLTYLQAITDGGLGLWHPHHLVYNAIGAGWLRLVRSVGVVSDGLKVVAWVNSALGATCAPVFDDFVRTQLGDGVMVFKVSKDSVGERVGLERHDLIKSVNGTEVMNLDDLQTALENAGDKLTIEVVRKGKAMTLQEK